jgi:hypothetical protein
MACPNYDPRFISGFQRLGIIGTDPAKWPAERFQGYLICLIVRAIIIILLFRTHHKKSVQLAVLLFALGSLGRLWVQAVECPPFQPQSFPWWNKGILVITSLLIIISLATDQSRLVPYLFLAMTGLGVIQLIWAQGFC